MDRMAVEHRLFRVAIAICNAYVIYAYTVYTQLNYSHIHTYTRAQDSIGKGASTCNERR